MKNSRAGNNTRGELIQTLVGVANEMGTYTVQDKSLFFAFFYALVILKKREERPISFSLEVFKEQEEILLEMFPTMGQLFHSMILALPTSLTQKTYKALSGVSVSNKECDNTISWLYQSLKKSLEKAAFSKLGKESNKISGAELLYTTQFFTDEYMVQYLVNMCLTEDTDPFHVVFVDPAVGGGNFLTYAFSTLFERQSKQSTDSPVTIASGIIQNQLIGYDLDATLANIAQLSLYINVALKIGMTKVSPSLIFGGEKGDITGYLSTSISSNMIEGLSFESALEKSYQSPSKICFVTNPPFMGKRDMDTCLKNYLVSMWPDCKGDLCFSFMNKLLQSLRPGDFVATVSQNGWMSLSSLKALRKTILTDYHIKYCVDMGSDAFYAINGEKTNIVLALFSKGSAGKTVFFNLKTLSHQDKVRVLSNPSLLESYSYSTNQQSFFENASYELSYELIGAFSSLNALPRYSQFGKPMQGTSTGDNGNYVKHIWDIGASSSDWKLVSKGGGYSKWQGLNYYKVLWGDSGELISENPGSALRNVKEQGSTELVYSDTGTLGLNVRFPLPGQIFIASGPGIKVISGDKYCHLAFLNSRIVSCILRIKNPKFTISAGYIGGMPVTQEILESRDLSSLSKTLVDNKQALLCHKLPNYEFKHDSYSEIDDVDSYVEEIMLFELDNAYNSLILEEEINNTILSLYHFNDRQREILMKMIFPDVFSEKESRISNFDEQLCSLLTEGCMPISKRLEGSVFGSENIIEVLSFIYKCSPKTVLSYAKSHIHSLHKTRRKYKDDLIHKVILSVLGVKGLNEGYCIVSSAKDIVGAVAEQYPYLSKSLHIDNACVKRIVEQVHTRCFFNDPILRLYA